jgi:hypothetical protein
MRLMSVRPLAARLARRVARPALALALLAPLTVPAQEPGRVDSATRAAPAAPGANASAIADTIEYFLQARMADAIRADRDGWLGVRREAESRWAVERDIAQRLRGEVGGVEQQIDGVERRIKEARKAKNDTLRTAAEGEKRVLERRRDLVRLRRAVHEAQAEQARLERDHADAAVRAADAEQAIAERRLLATPADPVQRLAFEELQSRWLQALRTREARLYDVADRKFRVVEARIALLERSRRR